MKKNDRSGLIFCISFGMFVLTASITVVLLRNSSRESSSTTSNSIRGSSSNNNNNNNDETSTILGARDVIDSSKFPFFVEWNVGCGGSLIHEDIILSAAHCCGISNCVVVNDDIDSNVLGQSRNAGNDGWWSQLWNLLFPKRNNASPSHSSQILWIGGTRSQQQQVQDPVVTMRKIESFHIHPDYDNRNANAPQYDVVLLHLTEPVKHIEAVPWNSDVTTLLTGKDDDLSVLGFEYHLEQEEVSVLQQVNVTLMSNSDCQDFYGQDELDVESMLCAGTAAGRTTTTTSSPSMMDDPRRSIIRNGGGDTACGVSFSGGPLLREVVNGEEADSTEASTGSSTSSSHRRLEQVGVVSWAGLGCTGGYPGIYTRTSSVDDWIQQSICELSSNPPDYC